MIIFVSEPCPDGSHSADGVTGCKICPNGKESNEDKTECGNLVLLTYQDECKI